MRLWGFWKSALSRTGIAKLSPALCQIYIQSDPLQVVPVSLCSSTELNKIPTAARPLGTCILVLFVTLRATEMAFTSFVRRLRRFDFMYFKAQYNPHYNTTLCFLANIFLGWKYFSALVMETQSESSNVSCDTQLWLGELHNSQVRSNPVITSV
jgi:hypothetical protein